jgi:hypothetical protein
VCELTGTFQSFAGAAASGSVLITPTTEVVDAGGQLVLAATTIVAPLSAEGTISVPGLVCTGQTGLNPLNWAYTFSIAVAGAEQVFTAYLPAALAPAADISQLIAAPPPAPVTTYVTSVNGMSGAVVIS